MSQKSKRGAGFTLIELVIAVAIAAILARMGFSAYRGYIVRSNRALAATTLRSVSGKLEALNTQNALATNSGYPSDFSQVNGGVAGQNYFLLQQDGSTQLITGGIYKVTLTTTAGPPPTYQLTAQPIGDQASDSCGSLGLDSYGRQTVTGTGATVAACWGK